MGRVLVVDDSEMSRAQLEGRVRKLGHDVETAESGLEALVKISGGGFDAVLLDVVMEDMDGHAVLTALSRQGKLDGLPVVVVSGVEDDEEQARCLDAGAREFVRKSLDVERLDQILTDLIGATSGADTAEAPSDVGASDGAVPEIDLQCLTAPGKKSPLERAWAFEREASNLLGRVRSHSEGGRMALAVESCRELHESATSVGLMAVAECCAQAIGALESGETPDQLDTLDALIERGRELLKSHKSEL